VLKAWMIACFSLGKELLRTYDEPLCEALCFVRKSQGRCGGLGGMNTYLLVSHTTGFFVELPRR
jgi:hypothetical protein